MQYRPEIDGLRALAVIPVILYHAGFNLFSGGYVGVDVFFVISGYLITSTILADLEVGTFSFMNFYERRARRILPALFSMMFACLPFAWFWLLPAAMTEFSESLIGIPLFISNLLVLYFWNFDYFDTSTELKPLIHTWSLAVEEQYYALFPVFLMLLWRLGKRWIMGLLFLAFFISLASSQWLSIRAPQFNFYMLPTRGWELLIGAFISLYYARHIIKIHNQIIEQLGSFFGLLLIVYPVFSFNAQTPFPSLYALAPTVGAALIIIFATHKTVVGKLLSSKLFVAIGLISYSAYLWHQPIFAFARERSLIKPSVYLMSTLAALSFAIAYLSWRYIEIPFRNKHRISRNKVFLYGTLCTIFFIGVGFAGYLSGGFEGRLANDVLITAHSAGDMKLQECMSQPNRDILPANACILGNKKKIIGGLIGDSHAGAIAYALNLELQKKKLGVVDLTAAACPPIPNVYTSFAGLNCYEHNNNSFKFMTSDANKKYVIISARWTLALTGKDFDNGEGGVESGDGVIEILENGKLKHVSKAIKKEILQTRISNMILDYIKLNKTVILVYPIPEVGWNVPLTLAKQYLFNKVNLTSTNLSTSYVLYKTRNKEAIQLLDSIGTNQYLIRIYPDKILCDTYVKDRCVAQINGMPLYFDDDHLNTMGANLVVKEIMKHIK